MEPTRIRPPAVAGSFYESRPEALVATISMLMRNTNPGNKLGRPPKALVVPHAGFIYSGPVAAEAFALLVPWGKTIRRVVLLGPAHRVPVRGLTLPDCDGFATPLGIVPLDTLSREDLVKLPQVAISTRAHSQEHSLEVQLPFLQSVLEDFVLVPLVVGLATPQDISEVLDLVWGGPETLVVVSTDLSHYHSYDEAVRLDSETAGIILGLGGALGPDQACGVYPLAGLLKTARDRKLTVRQVALANSGDTSGDKDRVVGYGAFAFYEGGDR